MGLGIDVARKGAGNGTLHRMALAGIFLATGLLGSAASINPVSPALAAPADSSGAPAASSAVPKLGGTELYGYLPYWQMTPSMVRYLSVVPVSTLDRFLTEGAFLAAVVTKGVDVHTVAHLGRGFTAPQRTALEFRDPECAVIDCPRTEGLERDHRTNWADTHHSAVDDADRLCDHHHDLKTYQGWALESGTGKRKLLSPDQHKRASGGTDPPALFDTG